MRKSAAPYVGMNRLLRFCAGLLVGALLAGCAHYPVNPPLEEYNSDKGYRIKNMGMPGSSESLLLVLTFSGGGTRAVALSYGVLEELAKTEIFVDGRNRYLLDEVDVISAVSGGSVTAAYYGLFGRRIFEEFEGRFLKKNIQGTLFGLTLLPRNFFRLLSPYFDRSDLAAEYYDKKVFDGGTFGDIAAGEGPTIFVNATDMTLGTWFTFYQDMFDVICSDVSRIPVARAVAASSAVPVVLSPISLRNYAGRCDFEKPKWVSEALEGRVASTRRFQQAVHVASYMDSKKKPYIHLIDGGIADNLGLRVAIDRMIQMGDLWRTLEYEGLENTRKVAFIVVNAETKPDTRWDRRRSPPTILRAFKSATSVPISRYNFETVELLKENLRRWAEDFRSQGCGALRHLEGVGSTSSERDSCDDIQFYVVEVNFDALPDESESSYLKGLPTSFKLPPETVDQLRDAAHRILAGSPEFQRLLRDLK